jgi:large subunit ribosomal protein L28
VRLKLSVNAIRTIEKNGGLDSYLLAAPDAQLSIDAIKVKHRIAKAAARQAA